MKEYKIRSIRDIYLLPTDDMVKRCMQELTTLMLTTRNVTKTLELVARDIAKKNGIALPEGPFHGWPDEIVWRDDNGGTSHVNIPFGEQGLKVDIKHSKQEDSGY